MNFWDSLYFIFLGGFGMSLTIWIGNMQNNELPATIVTSLILAGICLIFSRNYE